MYDSKNPMIKNKSHPKTQNNTETNEIQFNSKVDEEKYI